jgi:fatty acid CoA ligase FadD9
MTEVRDDADTWLPPLQDVIDAARAPGLRLPQILHTLVRGYGQRQALGRRATALEVDPQTGRTSQRLQPAFDTISYADLWAQVQAIAAAWTTGADPVRAGDFIATIGFASSDYVAIDMVAVYLGAVAVPLQHNSSATQLHTILQEAQPRVLAVSADYLDLAIEAGHGVASVRRLVAFDYNEALDAHREALDRVRARFEAVTIENLPELMQTGRDLPVPQPFTGGTDERLAMILYTSGSTGTPKGAMWTERMVSTLWTMDFFRDGENPVIGVNFMPLNHLGGRIPLSAAFQAGGTSYFVPESDLSTLFDDFALVRPTHLTLVPRVVDMLYQHLQTRLSRLIADGEDPLVAEVAVRTEIRDHLLGGRVVSAFVSTAPLASEMRHFIESSLDIRLVDGYGLTEVGGVTSDGKVLRPPVIDYKLIDVPELGYYTTDRPHPRGELLVKTATATPGYYRRPDVTAQAFDADGYYRTGDVMAEIEPDHLAYVDRRNNVIKLAQGEFVALANLEAVYSGAPLVRQIFVYGNSERSSLLAVIVPTEDATARYRGDELKAVLRDSLMTTARSAELQSYELPVDFLIELEPFTTADGLLSGVGKLLRPKLKERYGDRLEQLYAEISDARTAQLHVLRQAAKDQPVLDTVLEAAQTLLGLAGAAPSPGDRFIDLGGDSLSALTLSNLLRDVFDVEVPVGVIISPTSDLAKLATYVDAERISTGRRPTAAGLHGADATTIAASDLRLERFIDEATLSAASDLPAPSPEVRTVLLTGATGYLGRFLALEWLQRLSHDGGRVIALVRGTDAESAYRRLERAFDTGDQTLLAEFRRLAAEHLEVIPGDIAEAGLGVDLRTWERLALDVDLIVHPGALVNHKLPYAQLFGPNVVGTAEVIRLALSHRIKPVTYLSTVAVALGVPDLIEDGDIRAISPRRPVDDSYANGYANSKWAGEVLLREAHDLAGLPVSVFRSDMILAHNRFAGQVNVPDAFTRLLISVLSTGLAPRSFYAADGTRPRAHYPGLPVDFVAAAVTAVGARAVDGFRSYDVMNPHDDGVSLDVFIDWLIEDGAAITRIDGYADWLARFEAALNALPEDQRQRSVLPLLDAYRIPEQPLRGAHAPTAVFRAAVRAAELGPRHDIPHLDRALISKYLADLQALDLI